MKNNNVIQFKNSSAEAIGQLFKPFGNYVEEVYIPLGRDGLSYVFYSPIVSDVVKLSPNNLHNTKYLEAVLGLETIKANAWKFNIAKGTEEENIDSLSHEIAEDCNACDFVFDTGMIRGVGLYPTKNGFVLNLGKKGVFDYDGYPVSRFHDGYLYTAKSTGHFVDLDLEVNDADFRVLKDAFSTFNFQNPLDVYLVVGSVLSGIVGSALKTRPIVCFEAEAGSGKTLLLKCISTMLHKQFTARFSTPQNSAQILASIKNGSTGIIMDEFESKDYPSRTLTEVLGLFRSSFSADEDSGVVKATGGKKVTYRLSCPVFVGGISPPKFDEAMASRTINFKLNQFFGATESPYRNDEQVIAAVSSVSEKFRSFMLQNISVVCENASLIHECLAERGLSYRLCDKWCTVIAGAIMLKQALCDDQEEVEQTLMDLVELAVERETRKDEQFEVSEFETILLNLVVPIDGNSRRLGDLLHDWNLRGDQIDMTLLKRSLESLGLNIVNIGGEPSLAVAKAECFTVLSKAFKQAGMQRNVWHSIAKDMPGAIADKVVKFGKKPHRAFVFPIRQLLSETNDSHEIAA